MSILEVKADDATLQEGKKMAYADLAHPTKQAPLPSGRLFYTSQDGHDDCPADEGNSSFCNTLERMFLYEFNQKVKGY